MEETFQLEVRPPLIGDPSQCKRLSLAALKINLSLHAGYDAVLMEKATKEDLVSRLEDILLTRRADILLREFVFGMGGDMDIDYGSGVSF